MIPLAEVSLVSAFVTLIVGVLIYGQNSTQSVNRMLLVVCGVVFYFGFTEFEFLQASDANVAFQWLRLAAFWYLLPIVVFHLCTIYATFRVRRVVLDSMYGSAILFSILEAFLAPFEVFKMPWGWAYHYAAYYEYVQVLWVIVPTIAALLVLIRNYRDVKSREDRTGVAYVFSGVLVPVVAGIFVTVLPFLMSMDVPDLTAPSAAVGFLLVGYGVIRHGNYILTANVAADDILSTMADALFLVNRTGKVIVSNKAASTLLEYEASELIGSQLSSLASDSTSLEALFSDSSTVFESYFKTKQGRTIAVSLSKSAISTRTGDVVGYVIICRDTTTRKQAEEALSESERRFRDLTDLLPEIVWEINTEGTITFLNRAGLDFAGYDADDLRKGLNLFQVVAPESLALLQKRAQGIINGERALRSEYVFVKKDGSRFPGTAHSSRIMKDGRPVGLRGVIVDITERKRMEDSLRESERRFRELADLLPQIVFETDENGILTFFNRMGLSLTGYTEEDLRRGFDAFRVLPPEDAKRAMEKMRRVMKGEQTGPDEYHLLRKDGTLIPIVIYSNAIIREGKPVGLRGTIVDITERKQMEENLLKSRHLAAVG
jgi:PAS domain S-box-containing protein